jgi:hypothetical protein
VAEAEGAARRADEKIPVAPAAVATRRGREEAEAVAAAAGEGKRVEAVGAEQEQWRGGAEDADVEVAQAAGSRGVAVVVLGRRLHRHEGTGKGERSRRPEGREGEPCGFMFYACSRHLRISQEYYKISPPGSNKYGGVVCGVLLSEDKKKAKSVFST